MLEQSILDMKNIGYSDQEIATNLGLNENKVHSIIKSEGEKKDLYQFVLEGLRSGMSQGEIASSYTKKKINQAMVSEIVNQLIYDGLMSEEELTELRKQRREKLEEEKRKQRLQGKREKEKIEKTEKIELPKKEQIETLKNQLLIHPELMTIKNIKAIVMYYVEINSIQPAIVFVNKCINEYERNVEYKMKLIEIRDELIFYKRKVKVERMIKAGYFTDDEIANETGIPARKVREIRKEMNTPQTVSQDR